MCPARTSAYSHGGLGAGGLQPSGWLEGKTHFLNRRSLAQFGAVILRRAPDVMVSASPSLGAAIRDVQIRMGRAQMRR